MLALATECAREQASTQAHALTIPQLKSPIGGFVGMQSIQHSKSPIALSLYEPKKPAVVPILKLPVQGSVFRVQCLGFRVRPKSLQ